MNIFKVMTLTGRDPQYYRYKRDAKADRDMRSAPSIVCRGPDHWRGESFNVTRTMQKSRRNRR